jgi:predicted RNA polymerase sigma factor
MPWPRLRQRSRDRRQAHRRIAKRAGPLSPQSSERDLQDLLRELAPRVLGALVRRYGHFDTAEDAVQEALIAAATSWPADGRPDNPLGWLITVAFRRLTDLLRAQYARERRQETVARLVVPAERVAPPVDQAPNDFDDTLILLFMCWMSIRSASRIESR